MNNTSGQGDGAMGKAIGLVFMTVFIVASVGMSIAFLGAGSAMGGIGGPFASAPMFMAVVPIGFVIIGVLMFIRIASAPSGTRREVFRPVEGRSDRPVKPVASPTAACPGCGSRKNIPGAPVCAYCGGNLAAPNV